MSGKFIYIYIYIYIYIKKTRVRSPLLTQPGRPDSSLLFKSCEIDKSQGRLVY